MMKNKQTNPDLKIRLSVPSRLLQNFDEAIQGNFPSRNEAIRRGMILLLKEIRQPESQNHEGCSGNAEHDQLAENEPNVQRSNARRN